MNRPVREPVVEEPDVAETAKGQETARPTAPMPSFSRFILVFLFLLAFWAMFDRNLADGFAEVAGFVLTPAIGFGGNLPVITILIAGMLTTTISSIVRDYFTDWVRMARTQKLMGSLRKAQMEAMRRGNASKVAKLKEAQQTYQKDVMDMTFSPYKSMALTMFLFIVMFTWIRHFVDGTLQSLGNMWIAVPWSSNVYLPEAYVLPAWILLYSLLALPIGQIMSRVLKYVRFRRRLQAMGIPLEAEAEDAA